MLKGRTINRIFYCLSVEYVPTYMYGTDNGIVILWIKSTSKIKGGFYKFPPQNNTVYGLLTFCQILASIRCIMPASSVIYPAIFILQLSDCPRLKVIIQQNQFIKPT